MEFSRFDSYLGEALFRERVVRRITQEEMAQRISVKMKAAGKKKGISRQAYAFYEKGERSMPWDVYTYACEILSIDRNKLFNEACDFIKMN